MDTVILLKLKSYDGEGKFLENETGKELMEEEAIEVVQEFWRDMPMDYYSWDLEKVFFKW